MQTHPLNDAVVSLHQGVRMTYRDFHEKVEEAARGLLSLGVQVRWRLGSRSAACLKA